MQRRPTPVRYLCRAVLLATVAVACGRDAGRGDAGGGGSDVGGGTDAAATPSGGAADARPFAFTAADLDAYERGLTREIEVVRAAQARQSSGTTPEARAEAMRAQWKEQTIPEGARSAGIPLERYERVRETVNRTLQTLDFQGKIDGPMSLDTSRATPEMRRMLASDPFAELAPESAAALRARLDRLVTLWGGYVELTAVAG